MSASSNIKKCRQSSELRRHFFLICKSERLGNVCWAGDVVHSEKRKSRVVHANHFFYFVTRDLLCGQLERKKKQALDTRFSPFTLLRLATASLLSHT